MTDIIERAPAPVLMADTPGLVGTDTQPVSANVDAQAQARVGARTARLRAFLDVVTPLPVTERPWVPDLAAATGGGEQVAEKTAFPDSDLTITGQTYTPSLVGGAWNVSWQVMQAAPGAIDVLIQELALRRMVEYVLGELLNAATAAADIYAAAEAVEDAGYPVDFVAGATSVLMQTPLTNLDLMGIQVFGGLPMVGLLVGSLGGTYGASSDVMLRQVEPAIGGYEVSAFGEVVVVAAPGSLATVAPTP